MAIQRRSISLDPGVFVVRYAFAEEFYSHPKVRLVIEPPHGESLSFVTSEPALTETVLWSPGSGTAVLVSKAAQLVVEIVPAAENASTNATIKIDKLTNGQDNFINMGESRIPGIATDFTSDGLKLVGHVAGRGDVSVGADEWLGGPAAPARIEGIGLEWPQRPRGLEIRYAVALARPNVADPRPVSLGEFAGSRGRAIPIVGVSFEMSGPLADQMQLHGEALFLGSPLMRSSGRQFALSGPSRREPLVGLRIKVERIKAHDGANAAVPDAKPGEETPTAPGRVRVFRKAKATS